MAHSTFTLDHLAYEDPARQVIRPEHIMPIIQEDAGVDTQLLQSAPPAAGLAGLQKEQGEQGKQAADTPENLLLKCIMEDASDHLHAFQEYEHYTFGGNSWADYDILEDKLFDEMEDISSSDDEQLVPVKLQGVHGQQELLEQEVTRMSILDKSPGWKSAQEEDMLLNSSTQQVGGLDTFQKNKPSYVSDFGLSDDCYPDMYEFNALLKGVSITELPDMYQFNDRLDISSTDVLNSMKPSILPPHSNSTARDISNACAKTRSKPYQLVSPGHDMLSGSYDGAFKFTMDDLNIITGNFSESLLVGEEGSGSVYHGLLKDGTIVVVKRIKKNDKNVLEIEDAKDFQTQVDTLSKENHLNLVKPLGFMEDENEQILVTEYVTNGNLRQHLDGVPYGIILDMAKRCRISLDVVAALTHLHSQIKDDLDIIHRDIKSSDILITDDFRAKIVGFGFSRRSSFGDVDASSNSTQVKETLGYMALEHSTTHHLKEKNDVCLFGELLVEIFTGKRFAEGSSLPSDKCFTQRWVLRQCVEGRLMDIIDPKITPTTFDLKILEQIFKLAASCLVPEENNRPTIGDVLEALSFIVKGYESSQVQTNMQLGTQLEVDSKQASKLLVAKEDQTSPLFVGIIPDVFQVKSDEIYFEMLQEEIAKLGYISRLLSEDDEFEQNMTSVGKTSFFLYFNEKDDVFEFYFKNYQGMASIVGVGLECAKVVLEDGWRVTIQEISKSNWDDAWNFFDSSTMKVTISEPLEEDIDNVEDSQEALASIPRGQCLLLDLAQYFILKKAIASFFPRASVTHANTDSGTSSSPSNQDIASSSSSSDGKFANLVRAVKNTFLPQETSTPLKTKNGDGPPINPLGDDEVKFDTTVHLKLLPGGDLYNGNDRLDATILDDELKTLTSQLDNTIYLEMMFKFVIEDNMKEIQVTVGPISFQFQVKNEVNYKTIGRFGWYHKSLDISFGPVNTCDSEIGPNHNALDFIKVKKTITIGSSDATTRGISTSMNGGVKGKIPHVLTIFCGGSSGLSTTKSVSDNVGYAIEKECEETNGGFAISCERNLLSSTLIYTYHAPDYMHELDYKKLPHGDYRKSVLDPHPICLPQDVKFEGTWLPKDSEDNPQAVAEYSLHTSREVHMTSKEISKKVERKSWIPMMCGHSEIQKESNEPLKYTQKYARSIFLNHAMTHLNGEKFKVREFLHQRPLNEMEPESHLEERSCYKTQWHANPLVGLNSELDHQL